MMKPLRCLAALTIWMAAGTAWTAQLTSPDGRVAVVFDVTDRGGLRYEVRYRGKPIVVRSRLGFDVQDGPALVEGFKIVHLATTSHDETWKPVYGQWSTIRDHYRQLVVDLDDDRTPPRRLRLTFRAYDQGAAFRYTLARHAAWG